MRQNPNYNALRSRNKIKLLSQNVFAGLQNLQILWAETIFKFIVLNFISSLLKKEKNMHRKKLLFNLLGTWKRTTFLRSTRTPSCRWTISRICKWYFWDHHFFHVICVHNILWVTFLRLIFLHVATTYFRIKTFPAAGISARTALQCCRRRVWRPLLSWKLTTTPLSRIFPPQR